ncbi:anti-anti-sigma factor [Pokkaliibacter plantistimulans]|uniref:Anti-anti-sigma factor n=1 Tax=Pokkaliibacter plantistimulans TaxID=1635171 RepID=A0ABX5LW36_9GAMM|nr:STAS domain-containing protein [Pokkaliibacter plantistimulans]PXF30834.1 anti-anti-sigma factor [Pokkaliibacter plantistimulans]
MHSGKILVAKQNGAYILKFQGDVRLTLCASLDHFLESMFSDPDFKTVLIDLTETEGIDSTSLGLLAKVSVKMQQQFHLLPTIISINEDITRILLSMGFDKVFILIREYGLNSAPLLKEVPEILGSEEDVKNTVLNAHKTLMDLNEQNRATFSELVSSLENCQ